MTCWMLPDSKPSNTSRTIRRTALVIAPPLNARGGIGVGPLQVQPHVQRTIVDVRQRRVLIAHEAVKRAAAQAEHPEAPHG